MWFLWTVDDDLDDGIARSQLEGLLAMHRRCGVENVAVVPVYRFDELARAPGGIAMPDYELLTEREATHLFGVAPAAVGATGVVFIASRSLVERLR